MRHAPLLLALLALLPTLAHAQLQLTVAPAPDTTVPLAGRLIIALARDDAKIPPSTPMTDAPFWDDWQPLFGLTVSNFTTSITLDDTADHNLVPVSQLKPGRYRAAAWLITTRLTSSWKDDPGNLYSKETSFTIEDGKPTPAKLTLTQRTEPEPWPTNRPGIALVEISSKLLSDFHKRPVTLRAGILLPRDYDPKGSYAAVYEVPGFGGDHRLAIAAAERRRKDTTPDGVHDELDRAAFWIYLDPESPNGHHLFADSANNGPVGQALTTELIPAIEAKFPALRRSADSRLLRGHSSGGWSVLWLIHTYPQTFGFAWSTAPDPIDFRRFQTIDIYTGKSMYVGDPKRLNIQPINPDPTQWAEAPSFRKGTKIVMTVRQENSGEMVLGPNQTSGQQWHSWQAVFGPRIGNQGWGNGHPAALYNPKTGELDPAVAEQYKTYDLGHLTRTSPDTHLPIWRDKVRLVVGDLDSFYLNEAVALVKTDLEKAGVQDTITIVPGADHGSVYASPAVRAFPTQMLDFINRAAKPADR